MGVERVPVGDPGTGFAQVRSALLVDYLRKQSVLGVPAQAERAPTHKPCTGF